MQTIAGHPTADPVPGCISIRGARVHNLQNVDLDLPREQLIVITGPSGSGKSSLAFDTLYAEGQRQYIESLSVYARQFLDQLQRPDVDVIEGLQPTLCIDQNPGSFNPRSTVATVTEIYDYLRLLMARLGEPTCYQCGAAIRQQSTEEIQQCLLALPPRTKLMILSPRVRGRRGRHADVLAQIRKAGFVRVRVDGVVHEVERVPELAPRRSHDIEAVVDRVVIREGIEERVAESVRLALRQGEGLVIACTLDSGESADGGERWRDELFSTLYACPKCRINLEKLEPRTFSFNSPYGACPVCEGLGTTHRFDPELVVPERGLSLAGGAVAPWKSATAGELRRYRKQLQDFLEQSGIGWEQPLSELSGTDFHRLLHGDGGKFLGLLTLLEKDYATATRRERQEALEPYRDQVPCSACNGSRLRPEATSVRVAGKAIHEITRLSVTEARRFFADLRFPPRQEPIAQPIVSQIQSRLDFLAQVGVNYLTLDRAADTLSGGESQRVRLATSIGSGLVGVCYVLDEQSIGLHPRDNQRLIDALRDLQRQGNTVLVVEHDEAMMRQADRLIDVGPGAGQQGGRIVAQGTPAELAAHPASVTGRYLQGCLRIEVPSRRRRAAKSRSLTLEGVTTNNLKQLDVWFPLGALVCVTGVSGSGKSSLVSETLVRALTRRLSGIGPRPGPHRSLRGASQVDKVIEINQTPIGRTPRSNAATYTGAFDEIRRVFAATRDAKQLGFRASRFSFNVTGGRCEHCQGQGLQKIEMNFLSDIYVTCPECDGTRFNRQTLQVRYKGKSIADVLRLAVADAAEFFANFPQIQRLLAALDEVGLGYLPLGQSSTTLSGGEAQRIKLATELSRVDTGNTVYFLDEPTTGLHFDDIRKLLAVLARLVDKGNSVVVVEHNLDVIKCADWIIDLGPTGGAGGGYLLAAGTPEDVARQLDNATGAFLRPLLGLG